MTGEFSELRDAMESAGEKTSSSFDENELFKPAEDPNEKELALEQRKLTYKERRAIIKHRYYFKREKTQRHIKKGKAMMNEYGKEEVIETLFTRESAKEDAKRQANKKLSEALKRYYENKKKQEQENKNETFNEEKK